jgi:hypothetical protein
MQLQVLGSSSTTTTTLATMWQRQYSSRLAIEERCETMATLWVQYLCGAMWARKAFKSKYFFNSLEIVSSSSWLNFSTDPQEDLWMVTGSIKNK